MFSRVLVANRGEIAGRVIRTLRRLGITSVAVASEADRFTPPALSADIVVGIGGSAASASYLDVGAIIAACRETGAEAVHPGYGFLSERADFAEQLADAGIAFIGPRPDHLRAFGLKHTARTLAEAAGVPLLPGSGLIADEARAIEAARAIGYPVMVKSTAGGGGIGMQVCRDDASLRDALEGARRTAGASFGDSRVYLERFVSRARHVEVQVFGDGRGGVVTLGERDCSLQRRNQKVIEETPAPGLAEATRRALHEAAARLARSVAYESAGTVEFIVDAESGAFFFLEVNTRLQVEHTVTEAVFGIDLVEWMVRQAAGGWELPGQASLTPSGHAIEARLYAENPALGFRPCTGMLTEVRFPDDVRVDGWIEAGIEVTAHYDPLLAKLIAHGATREAATRRLRDAIAASAVGGVETNLGYLGALLDEPVFAAPQMTTAFLGKFAYAPRAIEVIAPGTQTSVQDWPGRLGYWSVGVPPSGPMDDRCFRAANAIVGNDEGAAALEMTLMGPTLRFQTDAVIALAGAPMAATLDGAPVAFGAAVPVSAGQVLAIGGLTGHGLRAYLAVRGGIDAPIVLGSRATFALGGFGGHATGVLRTGDTIRLNADHGRAGTDCAPAKLDRDWTIGVRLGPHPAPEFFTEDDIGTLLSSDYEVHYNSARTGVRLTGPKPAWARPDGGEAGLHPSNIHDNAYAIGSLDFTGDTPIILGPDGPSLGGFVCPAVVDADELWKLGQLKPGNRVRFTLRGSRDDGVLARGGSVVPIAVRRAGERNVLVEFGPLLLDLELRLRVQLVHDALTAEGMAGLIDLTPGIRSLQIHFDPAVVSAATLIDTVLAIDRALGEATDAEVASRIVHLPLSWDDSQARLAMRRYQELVRPDAPWCPSNIEFIRRINGLADEEAVKRTVLDASYLVMGLGDVYLGAPVATPIDPRHRLVTTKYNPARPWTPENAVGIGGAYLCIYGMEGPGGYQLFGRTLQVWNRWRRTGAFTDHMLLRPFDQIRFHLVEEAALDAAREAFPFGRFEIEIEESRFSAASYRRFLAENQTEIDTTRARREAAFAAERDAWARAGVSVFADDGDAPDPFGGRLPDGHVAVESPVPGNVWKLLKAAGDAVEAGETIAIVESMKMEMHVRAPVSGTIAELAGRPGREIAAGGRIATVVAR
jgi:urea carboxylase